MLSVQLPEPLHDRLRQLAQEDRLSAERLATLMLATLMLAVLTVEGWLASTPVRRRPTWRPCARSAKSLRPSEDDSTPDGIEP
jgi:hypothetical protein